MTADHLREELASLYERQRDAEAADLDGRVCEYAEWRAAVDARAERIRVLEQRLRGAGSTVETA